MTEQFLQNGFLKRDAQADIANIRDENNISFGFAAETNRVLMNTIAAAISSDAARGSNWSKEAVAVRVLMRSSGSFQGAVILCERGMATQSRMLVRSIVEDSFLSAALIEKPEEVIKMLRDDAEASRRNQAKFIIEQKLGGNAIALEKLELAIDEMDKKARLVNHKELARLSSMLPQYLNYQRLSDDAVHTSALSLNKHLAANQDRTGWSYRIGPANRHEIASTLHRAILAVLPVAIVVTQIMPDQENNRALVKLSDCLNAIPTGSTI